MCVYVTCRFTGRIGDAAFPTESCNSSHNSLHVADGSPFFCPWRFIRAVEEDGGVMVFKGSGRGTI